MSARLIALIVAGMLPACAFAGSIDLEQDLGGLDVIVALVPPGDPDAMKIDNRTPKTIVCSANFTGADQNRTVRVTVEPGKSATIRIPGNRGNMPRAAELKCEEKATAAGSHAP
jgi:hypothetical protein